MKEIKSKFKLTDFLKNMKLGEECKINTMAYKPSVVRSSIIRLNKAGFFFQLSEKGIPDGSIVTRLK